MVARPRSETHAGMRDLAGHRFDELPSRRYRMIALPSPSFPAWRPCICWRRAGFYSRDDGKSDGVKSSAF
jgi:hypothetical protein